ncbi:reverse transcriptase domain-containing protein [Tanacetum coccineum]
MVPATTSLVGFSGEIKWPLGQITLLVKIGDDEHSTSTWMDFMVVKSTSPFNGIMKAGVANLRPKERGKPPERNIAINDEVSKLVTAGIMRERLVDKTFHGKIGRNLEVYVDDLVIKSRTEDEVVRDIEETFKTLRKINMKLNPKKCTFGVEEGMFLGYQVNTKGIKICPDKVDAVLSLQSPKCLKDVQKLNGKLASLNRFLAKSAEKSLPFFKTLKKCTKKSDFLWTEEVEAAFRQMKEHIAKLPMLTAPEEQEELIVYLAASKEAVSAVLMTEREARQMPIYFVSRALRGPEVNYPPWKNWPRVSVKGQVLADFIVERPEEEGQDDSTKKKNRSRHGRLCSRMGRLVLTDAEQE